KTAATRRITSPGCRYRADARTRPHGRVPDSPAASLILGESATGGSPVTVPLARAAAGVVCLVTVTSGSAVGLPRRRSTAPPRTCQPGEPCPGPREHQHL